MTIEQEAQLALAAVEAIEKIIEVVWSAKAGRTDPSQVMASLSAFQATLAQNDANADKALETKFPESKL